MTPDNDGSTRRTLTRRSVLGTAGALGVAGVLPGRGAASSCRGRPAGSSPPPGPPALYGDPPTAPQYENVGPWEAAPLSVCGTDAYVDGEYLFQDFVYDDNGANTTPTASSPSPAPSHHDFGPMSGDVVYPTGDEYASNAADLLEFRTRLTDDGRVRYRFALNTMLREDAAAVAVGIDSTDGAGTDDWGHGIGSLGPLGLDHVLVTWGTGGELDGEALPDDAVSVDLARNQIEVELPLAPEGERWRHYLVVGLWDADAGTFKAIQDQPTVDQPGGAHGQSPPPVFNVGFRYDDQEPMGTPNLEPETAERQLNDAVEEATASQGIGYGHWREHAQSKALAARDISAFHADVDFAALERGETSPGLDDPVTGYHNRIYASNYELDDGVHPSAGIGPYVTESGDDNNGEDVIRGNLVPYALYVPDSYDGSPTPFHVHLHSLSGTYNQYGAFTPNFIRQVGAARDTVVMTTTGRGPGVPYDDQAELDVFEAWRDARHAYSLDPDRVTLGGYSMGGIGTHRIASKYPDLFAKAFPIAGSLGGEFTSQVGGDDLYQNQEIFAINQRHVPLLMWQGLADELAPAPLAFKYEQLLNDLGLRHEFDFFPEYDHLAFGYFDEWGPAAEFLDGATVTRSPQRVTYRVVPRTHNRSFDLVHDGAYWISDVAVADAESGLVNARSLGFGEADPIVARYEREGTEPNPHVKRGVEWKEPLDSPAARNALELSLEDVASLTVWVEEAALDPGRDIALTVDATTRTTVTLASDRGTLDVTLPAGRSERTVRICGESAPRQSVAVARADDGSVFTGGQTDQVTLTVDASRPVRIRDRLPDGWAIAGGDGTEVVENGTTYVEFPARRSGAVTYFAEAPSGLDASGEYAFGPVEVRLDGAWTAVRGTTDTNTVVGAETSR